jgi:hypothetical protein
MDIKPVRVSLFICIELSAQEKVFLSVYTEDHGDFCFIYRIVQDSLRQLVNGCDASAACNEVDMWIFVRRPAKPGDTGYE